MYAHLKWLWASGDRASALSSIQHFIEGLSRTPEPDNPTEAKTIAHILARCHRKQGNWQIEIDGGLTSVGVILNSTLNVTAERLHQENAGPVLNSYSLATQHDAQWSKAWHTWALSNWDIIRASPVVSTETDHAATESATPRTPHIVAAVEGKLDTLQCE
jgi:serine/threonine-protein kinase mTOR